MSLRSQNLLNVKITTSEKNIILEEVRKYLKRVYSLQSTVYSKEEKPLVIFTPNPEIVEFAQKDETFRQIVNSVQINIPDGQGICRAIKKLYKMKIARISGTDFMLDLCKLAQKDSVTIGLIGGRGTVAVETLECLQKKLPGLKGKVLEIGEVEIRDLGLPAGEAGNLSNLLEKTTVWILKQKIDILFVALGHPKQEYFISELSKQLHAISHAKLSDSVKLRASGIVIMAVGGAFDYISGRIPRAPVWMRERGLEWLYRLIKEPGRWKRQLAGLRFFLRVFFQ